MGWRAQENYELTNERECSHKIQKNIYHLVHNVPVTCDAVIGPLVAAQTDPYQAAREVAVSLSADPDK